MNDTVNSEMFAKYLFFADIANSLHEIIKVSLIKNCYSFHSTHSRFKEPAISSDIGTSHNKSLAQTSEITV